MNPVQLVVMFFNRKYCKHEYYIEDIQQTGIEQLKKPSSNDFFEWAEYFQGIYDHDSRTKRVRASCRKCGKIEYAHCGLDFKGKLVRKET